MKTFQYFKDKFRSKGQRSALELTEERKLEEYSGLDQTTKSLSSESFPRSIPKAHNLRVFSFSELKRATRDFDLLLAIGRSSFEDVYKGTIKPADGKGEPLVVAIKKLHNDSVQGQKEWLAEVQFLGVVKHPNLIKLIGHCAVNDKREIPRLLVYEFMQNKSLDYHLFQRAFSPLPWKKRLQIILGTAQGLAYLHEGLAVQVVGTYGYADPCYLRTGHLTVKSDVWGFNVVLYEILSGRRSIDRELSQAKELLLHWVKQSPANSKKFISIIDPTLGNQYSIGAAREIVKLADACLLTSHQRAAQDE
ncbi:putative receptor-like protein kinase [Gossypium australe]|uniref:Putative receptor-like protein kinase n=1 Tax=Gossypium australe TaxID=47621 RepID=A0A5B6VZD8_9ROSI|nr:putative receptor-like protein kinase [Gossypium australe]